MAPMNADKPGRHIDGGAAAVSEELEVDEVNRVVSPAGDLHARWVPSAEQTAAGVALLKTVPSRTRGDFVAVVALALPGKEYGLWETGQTVEPVPGAWLAYTGRDTSGEVYDFREAASAAEAAASAWLGERDGTVSYALVYPDGEAAMFESFKHTT